MDHRHELAPGAVLDRKYRIDRVIGFGGFGITYSAFDLGLATTVAIKEYYPTQFATRDSTLSIRPASSQERPLFDRMRESFLREARTLAKFDHSGIVRVLNVFEAHGTAYMVMRLETGPSLKVWRAGLGRKPTREEIDRIASEVLDALDVMHRAEFLHRDIAPDNIIIREDGSTVLLDFGATRRVAGEATGTMTGIVKRGYSPQEQYSSDSRIQGPWTDIYSAAGTFYYALTGEQPIDATERMLDDYLQPIATRESGNYRRALLAAIDWGLQLRPEARPQSIAAWRARMFAREVSTPAAVRPSGRPAEPGIAQAVPPPPVEAPRSRLRGIAIGAAALLAVVAMGTLMLRAGGLLHSAAVSERVETPRTDTGAEQAQRLAERLAAEADSRRREDAARVAAAAESKRQQEEAARVAAAEQARRAKEESDRKARVEEAARVAAAAEARRQQEEAERKAREETARIAAAAEAKRLQDEAERKAREETARIAAAVEAKRLQDEAERKAREETARITAAAEAKRQQDEAERKAREEAARIAAAVEAKRRQDEAERKAREETARIAAAADARRQQDEAERKAREETARIAAAADARRQQDEADRKAREEADRQARAASSAVLPDNRIKLVADIRKELNRVGCETPARTPGWTDDDQRALQRFVRHAGTAFSFNELNEEITDAVGSYVGRVCPAQCAAGEIASRDRCSPRPVVATPVQCTQINERAQLGSLTEEDRDILRSGKCRN